MVSRLRRLRPVRISKPSVVDHQQSGLQGQCWWELAALNSAALPFKVGFYIPEPPVAAKLIPLNILSCAGNIPVSSSHLLGVGPRLIGPCVSKGFSVVRYLQKLRPFAGRWSIRRVEREGWLRIVCARRPRILFYGTVHIRTMLTSIFHPAWLLMYCSLCLLQKGTYWAKWIVLWWETEFSVRFRS